MRRYKEQLRRALEADGWQLDTIITDGLEWWADEMWTIRSVRENWGTELVLTFAVDPGWEGPRKQGQGIEGIYATRAAPRRSGDLETGVKLWMAKGIFDEKLGAFVAALHTTRELVQRENGDLVYSEGELSEGVLLALRENGIEVD